MHRTTINVPDLVYQKARIKALREDVAVSEVIRDLLARWVDGDLELKTKDNSRARLVALARSARGMWADRDADAYSAVSRVGQRERDKELQDARLDV